jgi:hypothetical protein
MELSKDIELELQELDIEKEDTLQRFKELDCLKEAEQLKKELMELDCEEEE